jgi:hypothetical protein
MEWIKRLFATKECAACKVWAEQMKESRLREQRLMRQTETKDKQVEMVLASHYDRPAINNVAAEDAPSKQAIDALSDMNVGDDEFLEKMN